MTYQQDEDTRSALGWSLLALVAGAVGVAIETLAVTLVPFLVVPAAGATLTLMLLLCLVYSALPMPRARRLPLALLGGVLNLGVALLIWFGLRIGFDTALDTLAGGPGAVWEMLVFLSDFVSFTFKGQEFTGSILLYSGWLPELTLLFLAPLLMSRLELNGLH